MCGGGGAPSWTRYMYDPVGAIANKAAPGSKFAKATNTVHAVAFDPAGLYGDKGPMLGGEKIEKMQQTIDVMGIGAKKTAQNKEMDAYNAEIDKQYADQRRAALLTSQKISSPGKSLLT